MSQVSEEKIAHVARLARIAFSDDDARATTQGVGQILHLVDAMQATQTDNVEPTSQVTGLQDVLREDVVKPSSVNPERLLQSAPRHENGYIVVKRVLG
ncbi:Asp-tRNA(Asn)/Glu-tRNA(Gln) amidotransferase subunit GatC [bacterium]|jgi:aspartyl-tRNA(Asn)/glutamyl-tRNA(Gln) amidotransferase subunit C|nr:MAG: Asp-tRNA(Asn)/Glu-tRNA(Gln) amidotransferase subunit GatC [bacterium]